MIRTMTAVLLSVLPAAAAAAQGPPPVDIFLARGAIDSTGLRIDTLWNATDRAGYDNQPYFTPDGRSFFYTVYRDGQADVYRYDIDSRRSSRITRTAESEYSPTVMPAGTRLSVVRVEADSTQRLWSVRLDGSDDRVLLPDVRRVGYHAWLGPDTVALFIVGPPHTLRLVHGTAASPVTVAENVGRTLVRIPTTGELSYVQRTDSGGNRIVRLDRAETRHPLATTPATDFYAWTPDGTLLTADDTRLLMFRPGRDTAWRQVADLGGWNVAGITRLAVSPAGNWIAIVAQDPAP